MPLDYPDPDLTDGVVRLRAWSDDDLDCVREAASDPRIPAGTTVPAVFTTDAGVAFVRRQQQRIVDGEGISMAIADIGSDRARGLLWLPLRSQPGVMGLGYWVVPSGRNQGLGTRAVRLAGTWALGAAGMARVEAWVEPANLASQRLLVSAGFTREGVLRSFLSLRDGRSDAVVFSRISHET